VKAVPGERQYGIHSASDRAPNLDDTFQLLKTPLSHFPHLHAILFRLLETRPVECAWPNPLSLTINKGRFLAFQRVWCVVVGRFSKSGLL